MCAIFIFYTCVWAKIDVGIIGTVIYIRGSGEITYNDIRSQGDYTKTTGIVIENGPTQVKSQAFQHMPSLLSISFSKTIEYMGDELFYNSPNLNSFIVDPESKYLFTDGKALYTYNRTVLFKVINNPGSFTLDPNIEMIMSNSFCSCEIGTLVIPSKVKMSGKSVFASSSVDELKFEEMSNLKIIPSWMYYAANINKLHVSPSVTTISSYAFSETIVDDLIFDDINNSACTTLIQSAFIGIRTKALLLPPGVTSIPSDCFKDSIIESLNIPRDCASISTEAFTNCAKLTSITVDEGNKAFKVIDSTLYNFNETQIVFVSSIYQN